MQSAALQSVALQFLLDCERVADPGPVLTRLASQHQATARKFLGEHPTWLQHRTRWQQVRELERRGTEARQRGWQLSGELAERGECEQERHADGTLTPLPLSQTAKDKNAAFAEASQLQLQVCAAKDSLPGGLELAAAALAGILAEA